MSEPPSRLHVCWVAPSEGAPHPEHFPDLDITSIASVAQLPLDADAMVLDQRAFPDATALVTEARELSLPTLVMGDAATLDAILDDLPDHVEVCFQGAPPRIVRRRLDQAVARKPGFVDPLTGFMSRQRFAALLETRLDQASHERPVSLIFLDLDHFKPVNDEHGHVVGDEVLRAWGARFSQVVGKDDLLARLGGDEFAVFTEGDDARADALAVALLEVTRRAPYELGIRVTASAGIATVYTAIPGEELLRQADGALYAAKAQGRNCVVSFARLLREAEESGEDPGARAFENLTRVISERVTQVITHRSRRLFRELRQEADEDVLTGLFNRRYLDRRLAQDFERAREGNQPLALGLLDVDDFGTVNKTYGWPVGDRVLQAIAARVRSRIDKVGWAARYGGEELALVLPGKGLDDAYQLFEELRRSIEQDEHDVDGGCLQVTVSLGVVAAVADEDTDHLVARVSRALIEAKCSGRNRVVAAPEPLVETRTLDAS